MSKTTVSTLNLAAAALVFIPVGLNATDEGGLAAYSPSPSPSGNEIVFKGTLDARTNLWIANLGGDIRRLTNNPEGDWDPAWSPDGQLIAFASKSADVFNIWLIRPDGTGLVQLTSNSLNNRQPTWSPDGSQLAFVSNRAGSNDIWVMNADGSVQHRVTNLLGQENHPSFSPLGDEIVFSETANGASILMIVKTDGSGLRTLTAGNGRDWDPSWSTFGIVFSSNKSSSGNFTTWVIQANTFGLREIPNSTGLYPAWFLNGRIVFSDESPNSSALSDISLIEPTSGSRQFLTNLAVSNPCGQVTRIRGAFGSARGQEAFDSAADLNADGVIDIRDLALATRLLPLGLSCY